MGVPSTDLQDQNAGFPSTPDPDRFDLHPSAMLCAGGGRQAFVLSRTNPQRMIDSLARSSIINIWGGAALALISLALAMKWLSTP
jgi:hypothetical protein